MKRQEKLRVVTVVIVNFNGADIIESCLNSVLRQTYKPLEVIVVDNASEDSSIHFIRNTFPEVRVIKSTSNIGWGGGCNLGIAESMGEFITLVNNDTILDQNCVKEMVLAVSSDPRYGACAAKVLLQDRPGTIEACGLSIYRDGSAVARARNESADQYAKKEEVFAPSGCCCLLKRKMLAETGLFDETFFMYSEDADLGWRQRFAGWKTIYQPSAIAYHAHSKTAGAYSTLKAFHVERNRIYIVLKYFPLSMAVAAFAFSFQRFAYQFYWAVVFKKGALAYYQKEHSIFTSLGVLLAAHANAAFHWLALIGKRFEIHKRWKIQKNMVAHTIAEHSVSMRDIASYG